MRSTISCAETEPEATRVLRRFNVASDSLTLDSSLTRSALGLQQLLVEALRRFDLGDDLACFDLGADIGAAQRVR